MKDIVSIIKTCKSNDVQRFELGSLKIKFGDDVAQPVRRYKKLPPTSPDTSLTNNQLELDDFFREIQSQQLSLLDPERFEKEQFEESADNE